MQHLYFALRAVSHMEADRAVLRRIDCRPQLTGFIQRTQLEDIVLQLVQEVGGL